MMVGQQKPNEPCDVARLAYARRTARYDDTVALDAYTVLMRYPIHDLCVGGCVVFAGQSGQSSVTTGGDIFGQYSPRMVVRSPELVDLPQRMQVTIAKILIGKTITLDISALDTIAFVKLLVRDATGMPIDRQCVVLNGKQLDDTCTAVDCGLRAGSTLHVRVGGRGGAPKK